MKGGRGSGRIEWITGQEVLGDEGCWTQDTRGRCGGQAEEGGKPRSQVATAVQADSQAYLRAGSQPDWPRVPLQAAVPT